MGLNFSGKPLTIGSDLGIEVPTPTFSGLKSSDPDTSINPYTEQGPGPGGSGLSEDDINEIQDSLLPTGALVPYMTSNTAPSGVAWASTTWPGQAPWMAFDDPETSGLTWLSGIGVGGNAWVSYEFEAVQTVLSYTVIAAGDANLTRTLKDWTVEGWDGDSYVIVDTVTDETDWSVLEERTFTVDDPGTYIKYKIHATANNGDGNGFVSLSQWQMYNIDLNPPPVVPLALIPTMTSNTTPLGVAAASSQWAAQDPYYAFDDGGSIWLSAIGVGGVGYLSYDFGSSKTALSYVITGAQDANVSRTPKIWTIQGWDGNSWTVIDSVTDQTGWGILEERTYTIDDPDSYSKYKMDISASNDAGNGFVGVAQWQLYDMDLNPPVEETPDLIPIMTSNVLPSGTASASTTWGSVAPWNAFDDPVTGTIWLSGISVYTGWLAYEFTTNETVLSYTIQGAIDAQTQRAVKTWTLEGWTGSVWDVLDTVASETGWGVGETRTFTCDTSGSYIKYRLNITASNDAGQGFISVGQWQLYSDDQNA